MKSIFIFHGVETSADGQARKNDSSEERQLSVLLPMGMKVRHGLDWYIVNDVNYTFDKDVVVYDLYLKH